VTHRTVPRVVVAGVGSEWRRDDGVGPVVARRVSERLAQSAGDLATACRDCVVVAPLTDPLDLLGHWDGADLAVVVDATRSGLSPGTISRIELATQVAELEGEATAARDGTMPGIEPSGAPRGPSSTHGIGFAGALRLALAVGRAPVRAVVVGVEGDDFGHGSELSPAVAGSVDAAAACVLHLIEEAFACA